jgi:hypothetical protein
MCELANVSRLRALTAISPDKAAILTALATFRGSVSVYDSVRMDSIKKSEMVALRRDIPRACTVAELMEVISGIKIGDLSLHRLPVATLAAF